MHDKDNNIPASKGDGPLHSMFSVWNDNEMLKFVFIYALLCWYEFLNQHKSQHLYFI